MTRFLPFARPEIDEEDIAAVAEVLRSGWITSGPQVQRSKASFPPTSRPAGTRLRPRHRRARDGRSGSPASDGRRGHRSGDDLVASANVVVLAGGRPVLVDVDLDSRNTERRAWRPRSRRAPGRSCRCIRRAAGGLGADLRARGPRGLRVIEDAAHAMERPTAAGASARRATWSPSASTRTRTSPPSKEAPLVPRSRRGDAPSGCGFTASASLRAAAWTCSSTRQNRTLPTFRRASASPSSRSSSGSTRGHALARRYFRETRRRRAAPASGRRHAGHAWHLSRPSSTSTPSG